MNVLGGLLIVGSAGSLVWEFGWGAVGGLAAVYCLLIVSSR